MCPGRFTLRPPGHVAFIDRINPCRLALFAQVSAMTAAFGRPRCMMGRAPGTKFLSGWPVLFRFSGLITFE